MKLIFVRHGETYNSKNRLYQTDASAILPSSKKEIIRLAKNLVSLNLDILIVSGLVRSRMTGELLNVILKTSIATDPLLNEFREPKILAGKKISDSNSYILNMIKMYDKDPNFKKDDGESLQEFIDRIIKFRKFLEKSRFTTAICVSHGFYIRLFMLLTFVNSENITSKILSSLIKTKLDKLKSASFEFNGEWKLESWNTNLSILSTLPEN